MFPRQTKRTETGVGVGVGLVDSVDGISSSARPTSEALPCFDVEVCMLGVFSLGLSSEVFAGSFLEGN